MEWEDPQIVRDLFLLKFVHPRWMSLHDTMNPKPNGGSENGMAWDL